LIGSLTKYVKKYIKLIIFLVIEDKPKRFEKVATPIVQDIEDYY